MAEPSADYEGISWGAPVQTVMDLPTEDRYGVVRYVYETNASYLFLSQYCGWIRITGATEDGQFTLPDGDYVTEAECKARAPKHRVLSSRT